MPSSTRNSTAPSRPGEPCPDPSAHSHGDSRLRDSASKTAMQYGSKTSIFGPDGKLSAASAAASLKYAKPHELPSFPSVGIDIGDADDYYVPPPSSQANRAAAIASSGEGSREWWKYKGSTAGQSAAGLAFAKNTSPQLDYGYTDEGRKKALMAATLSVNGKGRGRAASAASNKTGTGSVYAANAKNLHMGPEMFTEHPPVAIEVEEKRRNDALRASAVSMAQSMYRLEKTKSSDAAKAAARGKYSSDTEGLVAKSLNIAYPGLQEAAQKLANERLARLDPDGIMAYRQHYGYGQQGSSQLTVENVQKQERGRNLDADSDEDEAQASKIRGQMSSFNAQLSAIDSKKRDKDRAALMAAAEKLVQARLHDMDEKVFHDTGKVPPSIMQSWEAAARAKATESSEQRMLTHGKVHIGGGKYMDQSEINAIAAARIQPILEETTAQAQKRRERDEEMRIEQEERKRLEAEEKLKQQAEKAEGKRKKDEEKLRIYQEKQVEKNKLAGERAELNRVKAEEKAERDKVAAEEKNLRDIKNAELKAEKKKLEGEEKIKREEEKAEREKAKAEEKEEQRQRLADERAATAATTTTTTTEEPIVTEELTTESVADEPITEVFVDTQSTLGDDLASPEPLSLAKSQESVTGTASEEPVTELVGGATPPATDGGIARAIADRIMGEPASEWGARDESVIEVYTEGKAIDDDAQTIKATTSEAIVTDGTEETVVPSAVAENIDEADGVSTIKDIDDDDVSPSRGTTVASPAKRIYGMPDPDAPSKGSRRKSFFDKMSKFGKRGSKTPKPAETKPVVVGNPSVGPSIVGAPAGGAAPSSIVHTPVEANGTTTETGEVTDTEVTDTDETFESLYDEPTAAKAKDIDGVSSLADDDETRGRSSYTSNERFEEANDQFDDALATPSGFARETSPARSASKFSEGL